MADQKQIEFIVERVVSEVFSRRLPELRQEVARRVLAELPAATAAEGSSSSAVLEAALASLQDVTSQSDVLNVMLDFAARFSGRVALFVVRSGAATVWQARGFPDDNGLRNFQLDLSGGVAARAFAERVPVPAGLDFDPGFMHRVGHAAGGNAILVPLLVRERVAALLYSDCGLEGGKLDVPALKLLMRSAGLWLEVLSLRKASADAAASERAVMDPESTVAKPAAASVPAAAMSAAVSGGAEAPAEAVSSAVATAAPLVAPEVEAAWSPEEREAHMRARRFARLLVDEIKLYNQAKVAEGRKNKDLYERLRDDIDKSRASYNKRYGSTPAASVDYFTQELIRILADNDSSLLGSSFPG